MIWQHAADGSSIACVRRPSRAGRRRAQRGDRPATGARDDRPIAGRRHRVDGDRPDRRPPSFGACETDRSGAGARRHQRPQRAVPSRANSASGTDSERRPPEQTADRADRPGHRTDRHDTEPGEERQRPGDERRCGADRQGHRADRQEHRADRHEHRPVRAVAGERPASRRSTSSWGQVSAARSLPTSPRRAAGWRPQRLEPGGSASGPAPSGAAEQTAIGTELGSMASGPAPSSDPSRG